MDLEYKKFLVAFKLGWNFKLLRWMILKLYCMLV